MAELDRGERSSISRKEADQAYAYERSLLPQGTIFPREGEVWEAADDVKVEVVKRFAAPFICSGEAILPRGERVRVMRTFEEEPLRVRARPLRYDELLPSLVRADIRDDPDFSSYQLEIGTADINQHFRRVDPA